jgi:hypothetical protein
MPTILAQLALEVFRAYMKAKQAAAAEGKDLDALLEAAATDNETSIFDVLGIPKPQ